MAEGIVAERPRSFYRPELDVLRFAAFLLVFIHHGFPHTAAEYAGWGVPRSLGVLFAAGARAGALGVDLFFALSAYLITELLLREQRLRGRFEIRAFYIRRILRIWPLYYFTLLVALPLVAFVLPGQGMPANFWLAFLLFAGNWACSWWQLYPGSFALLWSVSVEEQFYAVWPWVLRIFGPRLHVAFLAMLGSATVTRAVLIATHSDLNGMDVRIWTNTLARLDPIAGGALLALLLRGYVPEHTGGRRMLWIAGGGAGLWIAGSVLKDPGWIWLLTYPLAAAACVAILYGSFAPQGWRPPQMLTYLGKISFGLYVFHAAAIRLVQRAAPSLNGPLVLAFAFALTLGLAAISYRYLESPFLRRKNRFEFVNTRRV